MWEQCLVPPLLRLYGLEKTFLDVKMKICYIMYTETKVTVFLNLVSGHDFKLFPANI